MENIAIHVLISVVGAIWAHKVASNKGHTSILFGFFAFLFPLLGVLFAYVAYPAPRKLENL